MLFGVGIHHAHRFAFAQIAPQIFGEELGVWANHIVSRSQNGTGGSIVLFQLHHFELWKINRQFFQIVQSRSTPAVDGLVVVAHRGESAFVAHQVLQHLVLRGVGVLVFVHQHVPHLRLPFGAHICVVLQ